MKHVTRLVLLLAICAAPSAALRSAPLASDTPVYAAPDSSSAVLVTLPAGAEPQPATAASAVALPEGWQAIAILASLDAWVRDNDLNKELDVRPGSSLRAAPNADSAELGTMAAGDVTELRGIQGKWVQIHISKKTTGYINTKPATPPPAPVSAPAATTTTTQTVPATPQPQAVETSPAVPASQGSSVPYAANQTAAPSVQQPLSVSMQSGARLPAGTQAQPPATTTTPAAQTASATVGAGRTYEARPADTNAASVPRIFEGTFASTRRAFMPRRPYDYQLTSPDGVRLVYVDLGKVNVAGQVESYIGRTVAISGPIAAVPGTNDIVVKAETLQAK